MMLKEALKRGCALVVIVALTGYYSFTGVYIKAGAVTDGALVLDESSVADELTESEDLEESQYDIEESYDNSAEISQESQYDIEESHDNSAEISQEDEYAVEDEQQQETNTLKQKKNYIVKFNSKKAMNSAKKHHKESEQINDNAEDNLEERTIVSIELSEKEADKLEQNESVEYLEEDYILEGCKNEKKQKVKKEKRIKKNESSDEWNVRMIKAQNKKQKGKKQENKKHVKIAILDSGIDWGNDIDLVYQVSLVPGEEEMTQLFMDGNGHGSSVASLIAADDDGEGITGINPNVDIYSYRVLSEGNGAPVSRVVEAIYMAIEQKVNIINMSFGMDNYSEALETAIHDAAEEGILVIAAAGNTGEEGVQYPAAYKDVMAVGAVNKYGDVEDYSAKGEELEIVAPGELVRTTGFLGSEEVTSGTSLAAPQVAAVASLIWEKDLSVSADFVRGLLDESANLYGETDEYGNGLVDAEYALLHYDEYKKNYKKNGKKADVRNLELENNSTITTFEETGCVEGCWTGDDHEGMVSINAPNRYFIVRYGARFNDNERYKENGNNIFHGMHINPWWHGYYEDSNDKASNYIAAALYVSRMGDALYKGKSLDYADDFPDTRAALKKQQRTKMKDAVNNYIDWEKELKEIKKSYPQTQNQKVNKDFKRDFLWGMTIHTATDIFAHSVRYNNARIVHPDADVPAYKNEAVCKERYYDAQYIAKQIFDRYNEIDRDKIYLHVSDLVLPENRKPSTYKLYRISRYLREVDQVELANRTLSYSYKESVK